QRPHPSPLGTGDEDVADLQRPALDEHRRHRTTPALELRLDHDAGGGTVRVRLELQQLRLEENRLLELVEIGPLQRGYRHDLDVATHVFRHDAVLKQVVLDPIQVRYGTADLD